MFSAIFLSDLRQSATSNLKGLGFQRSFNESIITGESLARGGPYGWLRGEGEIEAQISPRCVAGPYTARPRSLSPFIDWLIEARLTSGN